MKFTYPAVFRKQEDGSVYGFFPDLACCEVTAGDLEDCLEKAYDAAYNWIELELSEDEPQLPGVSEPSDLELQEGDEVRSIGITMRLFEGWDE